MTMIDVRATEVTCNNCGNSDPDKFASLERFGMNRNPRTKYNILLGVMCLRCGAKEMFKEGEQI